MQIKVHFMPAWQAQSEERDVWVKMPQEPSPPAGGNVNSAQLLWGKLGQSLKGLNVDLPHDLADAPLGVYPREIKTSVPSRSQQHYPPWRKCGSHRSAHQLMDR